MEKYYMSPITIEMIDKFIEEMQLDWLAKQPKKKTLTFKEKRTLNQSVNTTCLL